MTTSTSADSVAPKARPAVDVDAPEEELSVLDDAPTLDQLADDDSVDDLVDIDVTEAEVPTDETADADADTRDVAESDTPEGGDEAHEDADEDPAAEAELDPEPETDEPAGESEDEPAVDGGAADTDAETDADEASVDTAPRSDEASTDDDELSDDTVERHDAEADDDTTPRDEVAEVAAEVAVAEVVPDMPDTVFEIDDTRPTGSTLVDDSTISASIASVFGEELTAEPEDDGLDGVVVVRGLTKTFGSVPALDEVNLTIPPGTFYGLVGPNGAGKTTTLSVIAGLLRPDSGTVLVGGINSKKHSRKVRRLLGILPDRLRTFDRLTGRQLLYYCGVLGGVGPRTTEERSEALARALDLTEALSRPVSDYSMGMTKKVLLAAAMLHAPRALILDEPFESVDPVSSANIIEILETYVRHGGTVILSSHSMELVERVCSRVAVLVAGQVLAEGSVDEVRGELTLEQRYIELAGGLSDVEGLEWLHTFSD